jgi:hypothetical protein
MYKLRLPRALIALLSIATMYVPQLSSLSFFESVLTPSCSPQQLVLRGHRPYRHQRQELDLGLC